MPPDVNPGSVGPADDIILEILFGEKSKTVINQKLVMESWKGPALTVRSCQQKYTAGGDMRPSTDLIEG